jgi:hypothetical protein
MNRCLKSFAALLISLGSAVLPAPSTAQTPAVRPFPANALRGTLVVTTPPAVTLDGQADRLAPGARIRNTQNLLALSANLAGQELTVNYVRDGAGLIHEVWILTADEVREKRASASSGRGFSISFGRN